MKNETDICVAYRDAKYKKHQIKILSELNACSEQDIEDVLVRNGYELPAAGAKKKTRAMTASVKKTAAAKAEAKADDISGSAIIELFKEKMKKLQEENERLNQELVNVYEFIKSV